MYFVQSVCFDDYRYYVLNNELHIVRGRLTIDTSQGSNSRSPEVKKERVESREKKTAENRMYIGSRKNEVPLSQEQNTFVSVPRCTGRGEMMAPLDSCRGSANGLFCP